MVSKNNFILKSPYPGGNDSTNEVSSNATSFDNSTSNIRTQFNVIDDKSSENYMDKFLSGNDSSDASKD